MFRIGVSTIAAAALLAGTAASPAGAGAAESGLEELWEEFPLDDERQAPALRGRPTEDRPATARAPDPAERGSPAQPENAGTNRWASERIGLLAAILALLVAAAAAGVVRSRGPSGRQGSATTRPTLRWLPPQLAPSLAFSPARRDVVGALLRAASADVLHHQAAEPEQRPKRPTYTGGAEMGDRKPPAQAPNKPIAKAEAEAQVLKRKGSAGAKLALKASERGHRPKRDLDGRTKEQLASTEAILLKEKLAPQREQKRAAGPVTNERPGLRTKRGARRESALRPVSASGAERDARVLAAARETRMRECEVGWWRGYVKSAFFAMETSSTGPGRTIAWSPYFRWRKRDVPRETPEAAAALRSLVNSLEREGWIVAGRHEEWFRVRFKCPSGVDAPGTIGGHQIHTG